MSTPSPSLHTLVLASERVTGTSKRLEKVRLLANCLEQLTKDETVICGAFLCGELRQGKIGVGYAVIAQVAPEAAPRAQLTLTDVDRVLTAVANTRGSGSKEARLRLLNQLFARATTSEQAFLRRLLLGELRQGALEGILLESVARATGVAPAQLRRALMFGGALSDVAALVLRQGEAALEQFSLTLFQPVRPMLAKPAEDVEAALSKLGEAAFEYKFDGARVQVHKSGDQVRVYSRQLHDVTHSVPEIVEIVRASPVDSWIADGEVIALNANGSPRPFQETMSRFGRKQGIADASEHTPLSVYWFDCLNQNGEDYIDRTYGDRFSALERATSGNRLVPRLIAPNSHAGAQFMRQALDAGHEGLMAKALNSTYEAGRRGSQWLKLKPSHTLDLVILAAEWGSGRRTGLLSNLHLGARDAESGELVMLGKTFKGLTDALLSFQTRALLARETHRDAYTVYVKPELVAEVAFDGVQTSSQYPGGVALRFARIKRYRDDKTVAESDTFQTVLQLKSRGHRHHSD